MEVEPSTWYSSRDTHPSIDPAYWCLTSQPCLCSNHHSTWAHVVYFVRKLFVQGIWNISCLFHIIIECCFSMVDMTKYCMYSSNNEFPNKSDKPKLTMLLWDSTVTVLLCTDLDKSSWTFFWGFYFTILCCTETYHYLTRYFTTTLVLMFWISQAYAITSCISAHFCDVAYAL